MDAETLILTALCGKVDVRQQTNPQERGITVNVTTHFHL